MLMIDSTSPQGNAFAVMGLVKKVLQEMGKSKTEINEAMEAMQSGDYDNLCEIASDVTDGFVKVVFGRQVSECPNCQSPVDASDLREHSGDLPDGTMDWEQSKNGICKSCRNEIESERKCETTDAWRYEV